MSSSSSDRKRKRLNTATVAAADMPTKKAKKSITIPSKFVKTSFADRLPVRGTSIIRASVSEPAKLISSPPEKWTKKLLVELMSVLTTAHSLDTDDSEMAGVVHKFGQWAMGRKEIYEAMDPSFVYINWGAVAPQPINNWNMPQSLQGGNAPVPIPNFPNCYSVATHDFSLILLGVITSSFAGVRVFIWDLPHPIVNDMRLISTK